MPKDASRPGVLALLEQLNRKFSAYGGHLQAILSLFSLFSMAATHHKVHELNRSSPVPHSLAAAEAPNRPEETLRCLADLPETARCPQAAEGPSAGAEGRKRRSDHGNQKA